MYQLFHSFPSAVSLPCIKASCQLLRHSVPLLAQTGGLFPIQECPPSSGPWWSRRVGCTACHGAPVLRHLWDHGQSGRQGGSYGANVTWGDPGRHGLPRLALWTRDFQARSRRDEDLRTWCSQFGREIYIRCPTSPRVTFPGEVFLFYSYDIYIINNNTSNNKHGILYVYHN